MAQATQTVPATDAVYAFIDRLVAARLVDTVIVGQRAMSRREIGRILAAASRRVDREAQPWLAQRIQDYASAFPDSLRRAPFTSLIQADAILMDSPGRGIEPDGDGLIDVDLNPLAANRLGQPVVNGGTYSYRAGLGAAITPWLAAAATQRVSAFDARSSGVPRHSETEQLYARALWKNLSVLAGRDYLFLGQGVDAGLMASTNARAVDQVRIASDRPFVMPWLLRYIGPSQATIALGDLGKDQFFPHTRLLAYKFSARPHPRFEIGTGLIEQVGGEGAPGGTLLQKAVDAIPIIDGVFLHRRTEFSNKFVGVDMRYALPFLTGAQFYLEGVFDDFDLRRVKSTFTEDAGYVWGLSANCLPSCGRLRASAEYHVTGLRFYTHGVFQSGFTLDRQFIGDPLGPRGRGAYAMLDVDGHRAAFDIDLAYEDRSGNKYGAVSTTPDDSDFHFIVIERRPAERRWRAVATATLGGLQDRYAFTIGAGAERVENFAHVQGNWRTNGLLELGVQLRPTLPFF